LIDKNDLHPRDIVLGNPMYPDQDESKVRPLLVISKSIFQQNCPYFICVGMTTNKKPDPFLIPMKRTQVEGDKPLDADIQIMCSRIVGMRHDAIIKKIAKMSSEYYEKVMNKIKKDILELKI